jgi:hypothetical protein
LQHSLLSLYDFKCIAQCFSSDVEESFIAEKAFEKRKHIHSVLATAAAGEMRKKEGLFRKQLRI